MGQMGPRCGRRKGTNGVFTHGVTANVRFFRQGLFGYFFKPAFLFPKVPGRTFLHNQSKIIKSAAAPLVLTPFVRNQLMVRIFTTKDPGSTNLGTSQYLGETHHLNIRLIRPFNLMKIHNFCSGPIGVEPISSVTEGLVSGAQPGEGQPYIYIYTHMCVYIYIYTHQ